MIRAVALDLEGTVVDLEWAHWRGHLQAAKKAGLDITEKEAVEKIPHFIGGPDEAVAREIASITGNKFSAEEILAFDKTFFSDALQSVKVIQPRPGFLRALAQFEDAGLTITIGSLTETHLAELILNKSGLRMAVPQSRIVLREGVQKLKPAPDVYLGTAEIAQVAPNEQLVFEDSPNGVIAARKAGSRVVAMPTVHNLGFLNRLLNAGANRIFFEWNEIRPMTVIRNLEKEVC